MPTSALGGRLRRVDGWMDAEVRKNEVGSEGEKKSSGRIVAAPRRSWIGGR